MYHKPEFAPRSRDDIERVITQHPFAMLITVDDGAAPLISHLPFVYDSSRGEYGALISHMAAPNPQAESVKQGQTATVVFRGVHDYVSPSWLSERSHTAPTWNYEVVECRGRLLELSAPAEATKAVGQLVNQVETGRSERWWMKELGQDGIKRRLPKIVCFELSIESWQAKFKLHQDELAQDVVEVTPRLRAAGSGELADRMEQFNRERIESLLNKE